jgi:hypothetical protein
MDTPNLDDYAQALRDLRRARELYGSNENLRAIYRRIWLGHGDHGGFLRAFAECVARADPENFELLKDSALLFAVKYDLLEEEKKAALRKLLKGDPT